MSILIKGIDLPKNGDCHHITIYDNGNTYITTSNVLYETDRKDVEVIEIPTPHGRLIDADEFKEIIKDSVPAWTIGVKIPTYGDMDIMDKIYFIPTILEEEE